jgi:hypothetical protein
MICNQTKFVELPEVLRFNAEVQDSQSDAGWWRNLICLPDWVAGKFIAAGWTRVEGTIGGHAFRAVLDQDEQGRVSFKVNEAMRKGEVIDAGLSVEICLLGPEAEPVIPADLQEAFHSSQHAFEVWEKMTIHNRIDWVRWIEAARKPQTRARRVERTIDQLAEGKSRACCVNVYEYMLNRIHADESGS